MKKLRELYDIDSDVEIKGIKINSKEVEKGDLFICTMGVTRDRHDFIDDALQNGASALVVSRKDIKADVPVIIVEDTNLELPKLCARFYDHPEKKLKIIGTTGTNGKTTVAKIIQDLLTSEECGYIGTNGVTYHNIHQVTKNTTPDADKLYGYLNEMVKSGCKYLSMEASSEAFFRKRLQNLSFDVSILTNITGDHLNIHKTLENYIDCKCELFATTKETGISILNMDDKYYEKVLSHCKGTVLTYGKKKEAMLQIVSYELFSDCTNLVVQYQNKKYEIKSPLVGEFNIYNLCAAILTLISFEFSMENIIERIPSIQPIEGRMESIPLQEDFQVILDYAHTKDALDKALTFLNKVKKGRIITVTGSAGGREKEKRSSMGKVVLEKSDYVIFTMDDPRYEDVNEIIDQMIGESNQDNYERVIDRQEAIYKAFQLAKKNDIIYIAGKGRDNYMAYLDQYLPYSDYDVIQKYSKDSKKV